MWKTWSQGVDWLTVTGSHSDDNTKLLEETALELMHHEYNMGERHKPVDRLQYRGLQVGSVFLGECDEGLMAQASGETAHRFALRLKEKGFNGRVSRLDFQESCQHESKENGRASEEIHLLVERWKRTEKSRQVVYSLTDRHRRGLTFACGSRSSESYIRAYNKSLEQLRDIEQGINRLEVELKGERARKAWELVLATKSLTELSRDVLCGEMRRKDLDTTWLQDRRQVRLMVGRKPTDDERTLDWLEHGVRKSVQRLASDGKIDEVLKRLGL